MDEKTPIDAAQVRAAAYLAAKQRLDFRAGKTRALVQCNPPNIKCGNRCIPPEWDCRLKGQGNDPHLAAKRTDPVSGIANIERGIKRLGRFARTGSFSELESSKRSFVRGAVKLKPGTLKEKGEFKEWIENNWSKVVIPVSVVAGGLALHSGLKAGDVFGYRKGAGAKIDDAVAQGIGAVLDRTPVVGQARAYTRSQAASAEAGNLSRIAGRAQRNRSYAANPESGIPATTIPRSWVAGSSDLSAALKVVDNQGSSNTFYEWNTKHRTAFWGATHKDGTSVFAVPTAHAFMNTEWNLNLSPTTVRADYVNAITGRIISDRDAFLQLAKQQGFKVLGRPGAQYIDSNQRDAFVSRSTRAITNERQRAAHAKYVDTVVRNLAPSSAAQEIYKGHVEFFDNYYKEQTESLIKAADAPDFDTPRDKRKQFENNVIAEQPGLLELRKAAERRRIDYLMQTSTKPNTVSKGPEHDALFLRDYYHTKVAGKGKSPYTITDRLAVQAASELSGKQQLTPAQAIQLLKTEYGFTSAEIEIRPGPQRRKPQPRTPAPAGDRPARRRTPAQAIASMMRQKNPDGTPRYATREAAEAAYKRAQEGRTDSEASLHFTPRVEAYLQTVARLDKRCGKSGIPENAKCSKPTAAQSPEAAQRAKGLAEPGVTCAPGTQQCGKICIPQGATCHIKTGGIKGAKVALAVGAAASTVLAARKGNQLYKNRRNIEAYKQGAPKAMNAAITRLSQKDVRRGLDSLPKQFRPQAEKLVGKAKAAMAYISADAQGYNIRKVNNDANFSVWSLDDGSKVLSVGSVGDTLVTFSADRSSTIDLRTEGGRGVGVYDIQFNSDLGFQQKQGLSKESQSGITSMIKSMNKDSIESLPQNAVLRNIPYGDDGLGRKRQAIYKRFGYKSLQGIRGSAMFATLSNGKVVPIAPEYEGFYADLLKGDDYDTAVNKFQARNRRDGDVTLLTRVDIAVQKGKPCGKGFIPKNQKCTKSTTAKYAEKKESSNVVQTAKVGAAALATTGVVAGLVAIASNKRKVSAYRRNVSKSALEAEKLAIEYERQFREQAATRLKKRTQDVTGYEASVYNYSDKGYDRGFGAFESDAKWFGQTKQSKGAVVMLSYADAKGRGGFEMANGGAFQTVWGERDILPYANNISQPKASNDLDHMQQLARERASQQAERVAGPLGKGAVKGAFTAQDAIKRFEFLRKNIDERGFNPDAVRVAAFVVAQRRLTGKPVDIMSYSNGGNVATETLAILSEMGYRDVKVINVAGPTFGIFNHSDDNMRTWVSEGDEFYKYSGGKAFVGGNTRMLKNKNIPHGLRDAIDPNNRETGANWRQAMKDKKSYLLDEQLQKEAYQYLTVDNKRANELVDEVIWRVGEGMKFEGDLGSLFGDNSTVVKSRFKGFLATLPRDQAKQQIKSEIEGRMLDTWYGGYNPKQVKSSQKAIRNELLTYTTPQPPRKVRPPRPASLSQRIEFLMKQNPGMSRTAARSQAQRDLRERTIKTDAYRITRSLTQQRVRAA